MKQLDFRVIRYALLAIVFLLPTTAHTQTPDTDALVVSEVLANPVGTDRGQEFIELANTSASPLDIGGYILRDASASGGFTVAPNTTIPAEGFITFFHSTDFTFALNNTGETITLYDANGALLHTISFASTTEGQSWNVGPPPYEQEPTPNAVNAPNELAPTPELPEPEDDPDPEPDPQPAPEPSPEPESYPTILLNEILPNPAGSDTDGEFIELYNPTDETVDLTNWNLNDTSSSAYTFPTQAIDAQSYLILWRSEFGFALNNTGDETVTLTDPRGNTSSTTTYSDAPDSESWSRDTTSTTTPWQWSEKPTPGEPNVFSPSQEPESEDPSDDPGTEVPTEPEPDTEPENYPEILLYELLPNPTGSDTTGEFIELYNPTDETVSLKGWVISDASTNGTYTLPDDATITRNAYYTIFRSEFGFALNNSGDEAVTLTDPRGNIVSSHTFTPPAEGRSLAYDDSVWQATTTPTANNQNNITPELVCESPDQETDEPAGDIPMSDPAPSPLPSPSPATDYAPITLSELLPNPAGSDTDAEFIELYNPTSEAVHLDGWVLGDASTSGRYTIQGKIIPADAYLAIYRSDSKIALNNSGDETVTLTNPGGATADTISFSGATQSQSFAQSGGAWSWTETPTPGAANIITAAKETQDQAKDKDQDESKDTAPKPIGPFAALVLNEILPNPTGSDTDAEFIELYNPTDAAVTLAGWTVRDASANGAHTFGDVTIDAKNYHILWRTASKIALNNSGDETVTLYSPDELLVDTFTYTSSTEEQSYNRSAEQWYEADPTPGATNTPTNSTPGESPHTTPKKTSYEPLLLSELLPAPKTGREEYIELYNPHQETISLAGWTLRDASKTGSHSFTSGEVDPGEYYVIMRSRYGFALNNSGDETVSLADPLGNVTSSVTYSSAPTSASYSWDGNIESPTWRFTRSQTPATPNDLGIQLQITDIDIDDAYREVDTEFDVDVAGATNDLKVRWDFGNGKSSTKKETTHSYKKTGTYVGSVTVSDGLQTTAKQFTVKIKKYPKRKIHITQIMPNPAGVDRDNEYIVITNLDKKTVKLKDWSIATGKDEDSARNHPLKKTIKLKPGASKKITRKHASISLPNSFGYVEVRLPDGRDVSNVTYDYENAKSTPSNALYTKTESGWAWSVTAGEVNGTVQASGLSEDERLAIIDQALANMMLSEIEDQPRPEPVPENQSEESTTKSEAKPSWWQRLKSRLKKPFQSKEEAQAIYPIARTHSAN